jgi:hypothetical protein
MNETKFTPGPWKAIRDPLHYGSLSTVYAGSTEEKAGIGAQMLVQVGGWSNPTEQEANAHLIAAAPELYTVLNQIATDIEAQGVLIEWHQAALAALAKARGEA